MKKIAHCLPLFLIIASGVVSAQSYQVAIPKDKSTIVDTKGKPPSASAIKIVPRIRDNYSSTFSRSVDDTERSTCGTMPFFEERHEPQRSCSFYGVADEPEVRDSYIPDGVTPFKTIRLYIHAFIDGNGDTTASQADVEAQMYTLNEEFAPHKISFEALYDVHYDSEYDSISSWGYYLKEAYAVSPSEYHNVFVADLDGYLGVSTFPWDSDALNIYGGTLMDRYWFGGPRYFDGEYDVPQRTLTHELGHALGLWHTHHGVDEVAECGSCYEGADGYSYSGDDNPDVVGDLCSDTKSTPTNFSCSDPSGTDCQGNNWVDTDVHNYMGYARDLCYNQNGEGFSAQQSGRMHAWLDEALGSQVVSQEPPPAIFFSEWAEGSSSNKYLEIYNGTNNEVDLSDFAFPTVANSPDVPGDYEYWNTFDSNATIAPGDVFVIARSNADPLILQEADMFFQYLSNGDDGICLVQGSEDNYVVIDCIGDWYGDPGSGWDVAGVSEATRDHTLIRKSSVEYGNPDWPSSAGTNEEDSEWIVMEQNYWDGLGAHPSGPVEEIRHSLSFDGDFDYVELPDLGNPINEMTIQFWIKAVGDRDAYFIMGQRGWSGQDLHFDITDDQYGKKINFNINGGGGGVSNDGIVIDDGWHNIAVTYENSNILFYYDGNYWGSSQNNGSSININGFRLGNHYNDSRWLSGYLDDYSIWSIALSEEQIQDYMYNEVSGTEPGLIGFWNFNDGEGTILTDLSGNGNHGNINGASWSEDVPTPPVIGCTDIYAENYNFEATVDDGSCNGYPDNGDYSLSFDGIDDYINIEGGESFYIIDNQISIMAWVNIPSEAEGYKMLLEGWSGYGYHIYIKDGKIDAVFGEYNVSDTRTNGETDLRGTGWRHITVSLNGNEVRLYVDGQLDGVGTFDGVPVGNNLDNLNIGRSPWSTSENFIGQINELSIWNVGIPEDHLSELMFFDSVLYNENLIARYKFSSGEGNILYDHSGNQNHGTISGADWILSGCTDPYAENYDSNATEDDGSCHGYPDNGNYSLSFDSDNVSVGEIGDYSSKVTVMGWVKTTDGGSYHAIVSGPCGNIMLTMHEGKLLFGSQCSTPIQHDTYGITELNDGEWHHVAATYDENGGDNNLRVYVDGVLEGQSTKTGQFVTGDFTIASSPAPGEYFDGNIDMLRIWDIALSEEQIYESMYNEFPIEDSHLLADWRFNDGEGDILFDHSGNSNHGEINGASWDEEGYQTPKVAVTFSVNMNDYIEETGDSLENHGGLYIAGGNIGAENPEDSLFMGHRMYDFDVNNIYEVTLELEKNTEYVYKYRIGPAEEDWSGNWEGYLDDCGTGPWGDRYFTTDLSDSMSVGPFCWNSCENCALPNRSLSFDGVDDYVDINVNTENDYSISGWFKFETADDGNTIIASNSNDFIRIDTYENQKYFGYNSPTGANHIGATALSENTWYHFAVTRSGSNLSFYLNGDFDGSFNEPPTVLGWVKIGVHRNGSQHHFHGNIDEVSIWNVAQTQEQIQDYMYNVVSGAEPGLIGFWNFNDGEGTILSDLSGNGNHGNINGASWSNDVMQPPYNGPEWYVSIEGSDDNNGSYEYPFASIQHAVDAANDYDLVEISPGEYFENVVINQTLQIGGNYEEGDIIVNGQQNGSVFHVEGLEDTIAVHLFGLRIQNGRSEKGAGVYVTNGLVQIVESWVQNNQTAGQGSQGGGVYAYNARLEISESDIVDNYADDLPGFGAGIYADSSELHIGESYISHNSSSSGSGGGIYITNNSNLHIFSSNVEHNNALKQGGGIFLSNGSSFYADEDVRINNNMVMQDCFTGQGSQGAGFYIDNSNVWYANGYVWANKSFDSGGAFFITNGSSVSFLNLAMDTNESAEVGGGENTIGGAFGLVFDSELSLDHCTIYGNNSISGGVSGLYSSNSIVDIRSSIFWNNPGQWDGESGQLIGSGYDVSYSDIQGGYEGVGNVDIDPLFCDFLFFELAENSPLLGLGQDGTDIGAAGIGCDPIYNSDIQFVDISISGNSAQFTIMTDSEHDHFHWNVDYGETFMSIHSTSVYGLDPGLHRFAAYLVDSTHQTISNVFIKHFLIQDGIDVYLSENFDGGDSTSLPGWGLSSNNEYGWEVNSQNFPGSNPNGWNVPQGSGNFIFAQDYNNGFDASEDYLILPPQNFSSIENPVALEFYSFFTGSRVYPDGFTFGKVSSGEEYDQSNYNSMIIEYGGDTVEDPFFIESIPFNTTGTITGYTNDYDEECDAGTSNSPDVVYSFTPNYNMVVDVDLCSEETFYDTKVFVYENSAGNLANTLNGTGACNDDYCSNSHQSYISFISGVTLFAGNTYYFVVDGWNGEFGDYDLNIYEHQSESDQTAHIEISTDGGENWQEIYQVAPTEYNAWEPVYVDLSDFSNESDLLIAFHSNDQGSNGTGWAVDDITLLSAYQEEEGFIIGSVYSEETGGPLSDVYVEAVSEDSSVYNWAITDSSGFFEIGVIGNKNYFFRASNEYGEYIDYFYVGGNETYDLGEIFIGDNTTSFVEGWVSNWYTGQPLGQSSVLLVYEHDGNTHTIEESTAPDGYFMVQVPADNNFDMFIYADGYWAEHDAFYLSAGDNHTLGIGIAPLNMAARVYGSITDQYSGEMIHGAEAILNCGTSEDWDHTGALGSYRVFSYYPGECNDGTLIVRAGGYLTQYYSTGDLNFQPGQSITMNIELEEGNDPDPGIILGRVHAANSGDGISHAMVSAYAYTSGGSYGVEADESGYYFMSELIGDQEYEVMVSAEGYTTVMETHYLGSGDSLYLDFYLEDVPRSGMFGFVQNNDGEPISQVNIYPTLNGNDYFWASTDDSGYYHVELPAGTYFVSTGVNNYYVSSVSDLEILPGEMVEVNFTLEAIESFDGGAAGIVYSGVGQTASGINVNFWNTDLYDATTITNENGAYAIDLVNGTYNVSVWGGGYDEVFIPGVTINNNIIPLDIYLFDNNSPQPPVIVQLEDVPNDQGGQMDMVWSPGIPMEWEIFPYYSVWRENEDSWHFISMVPYHDFNVYNMVVPTLGDSTHEGIHWSTFMVTAHTEDLYVFFDSETSSGYSIDNLPPDTPVGLNAEIVEGGVMLNWSAPLDDDFSYHNVYRTDVMSYEPALIFTTIDSFYIDFEIDQSTNYEYWVTAVDHNGNESEASNSVQISPTGLSTAADLLPEAFALNQNYPNPFNPSTQIRYALPEQSQVVLTVYDMLGRKVRTLVNGVQDAGYRTVMWNATSDLGTPVSAGMYIYTIRANEFYEVKKMILLK